MIPTNGDVVLEPRKVERAGLAAAGGGNVLLYVHKDTALADIGRRNPVRHYVVIHDKLRVLQAIKRIWPQRITTMFVRQGGFAEDAAALSSLRPAVLTIPHIAALLAYDLSELLAAARQAEGGTQ